MFVATANYKKSKILIQIMYKVGTYKLCICFAYTKSDSVGYLFGMFHHVTNSGLNLYIFGILKRDFKYRYNFEYNWCTYIEIIDVYDVLESNYANVFRHTINVHIKNVSK